jgi:hypothetical protein
LRVHAYTPAISSPSRSVASVPIEAPAAGSGRVRELTSP